MKALIVGGAGFIGSHLTDILIREGHTVVCVDNFSLGKRNNINHLKNESAYTLYETDASDKEALMGVFEKEHPDFVFHLAANSDIHASSMNPDIEYRNTYTTTYNILACMRTAEVKKLFFASTSAVYGDKKNVVLDEKTPELAPISYYGAAKLGSEALISAFSYMNDFSSLVFRFPNVVGPRLTHGVIYDFVGKLEKDPLQLEILGNGKQTKPYIYVHDLVEAIVRFMNVPQGVTLYNLGVEGSTSVTRIADILCEEMGLDHVNYRYTGGEGGWKGDVPRFMYCVDKIHAAGWYAKYNSDEAVRMAVRYAIGKEKE